MFAIAIGLARMRRDDFQQVKCCEAVSRDLVPKPVIAAGPDQPHIASLYLFGGHGQPIVHVVEIILFGLRKTRFITIDQLCLVHRRGGLGLRAECKDNDACRQGAQEQSATGKNDSSHDRFLAPNPSLAEMRCKLLVNRDHRCYPQLLSRETASGEFQLRTGTVESNIAEDSDVCMVTFTTNGNAAKFRSLRISKEKY